MDDERSYWNAFYGSKSGPVPNLPSQFAVFSAGEIAADTTIIDIGCGTGRDSFFFANSGYRVLGVDGSASAVDLCNSNAVARGQENARFVCADINSPDLAKDLSETISGEVAVYARFFLHAVDEAGEAAFLRLAQGMDRLTVVAVEFRTDRDANQAKVTPSHYRRFIPPLAFLTHAQRFGFRPAYFAEGFGFAKFRQDDAHVARVLLVKDRE